MAPIPKPVDELVDDRPERRTPLTTLPLDGFAGPIPEPTVALAPAARDFYVEAWRSPMGAAWLDSDANAVAELATLRWLISSAHAGGDFAPGTAQSGSAPWRGGVSRLILGVSRRC
jgi:hypothetical protein